MTMWIITKTGFLSIVQHRDDPSQMLVRARVRSDLEDAFPDYETDEDPKADYRYRAVVPRGDVATYLFDELIDVDYTSHAKEAMSKGKEPGRYPAYLDVWAALYKLQEPVLWDTTPNPEDRDARPDDSVEAGEPER